MNYKTIKIMKNSYEVPEIEFIEINVEKGYAASTQPGSSTEEDNEIEE